jgi:hypothetical protein
MKILQDTNVNTQKLVCGLALCALIRPAMTAAIDYRDPGGMTEAERSELMTKTNQYNTCVYKESMALVDSLPDIRQAADSAMKKCQPVIDEMKSLVTKAGFDPGFGSQFAHSAQNRAVRMLIPELALRKSGH